MFRQIQGGTKQLFHISRYIEDLILILFLTNESCTIKIYAKSISFQLPINSINRNYYQQQNQQINNIRNKITKPIQSDEWLYMKTQKQKIKARKKQHDRGALRVEQTMAAVVMDSHKWW